MPASGTHWRIDRVLCETERAVRDADREASLPGWLAEAMTSDILRDGVAGFVAAAGRSPEHVSRACRLHLGKTPTEVVTAARLDHAARLLERGDDGVTQIAFASGFKNTGHFHTCFRDRFGTTPRQYRLRQRAIAP